jgi:hypothetical protein
MKGYRCHKCKAKGCRLWRQYQTVSPRVLCCECAEVDQKQPLKIAEHDSIGWYVPAIPDEDGSFWGYTSVPQDRVDWWRSLPIRKVRTPRSDIETATEALKCLRFATSLDDLKTLDPAVKARLKASADLYADQTLRMLLGDQ